MATLFDRCEECSKTISDDEYVVNWGTCNECFDKHWAEYEKEMLKINLGEDDDL